MAAFASDKRMHFEGPTAKSLKWEELCIPLYLGTNALLYLHLYFALVRVAEQKMDATTWTRSGIMCMVLMSMLMRVVCQDTDNTACISSLTPCAEYLNATTKPNPTCCSALVSVIDKDAQCLCNLLNSDAVKQLGVNVSQAMKLPAECGKNVSASQCNKTAIAGGSSVGKTPTSTTPSSSASPSTTTTTKSNSNGAASVSVKMLPVAALLFIAVASAVGLESPCLR